jgi:hypothetical protein
MQWRKPVALNLKELSSGKRVGEKAISKRDLLDAKATEITLEQRPTRPTI